MREWDERVWPVEGGGMVSEVFRYNLHLG